MFCGKMQFRHLEGGKSDGERTQDRFFDIHADQRMHSPVPLLYGALSVCSVNDPDIVDLLLKLDIFLSDTVHTILCRFNKDRRPISDL